VTVRIRISRYQKEKELGDEYRTQQNIGETFTEFKHRRNVEEKQKVKDNEVLKVKILNGSKKDMTFHEDTIKKFKKKRLTPSKIDRLN